MKVILNFSVAALALAGAATLYAQTPVALSPVARQQFFDTNGIPMAGGKICTYAAGSTTPLATYTDSTGMTPNPNPIVLDASGFAGIWLGDESYKFVARLAGTDGTCATGTVQWSVDGIYDPGQLLTGELASGTGATLVGYEANGGVQTTVAAVLNQTILATNYASLSSALTELGAGQTLTVPQGTYAVPNAISVSISNIRVDCQPGAVIQAGGAFTTLTFAGSNITVDGCTFDGQSGGSTAIANSGGDNITLAENSFVSFNTTAAIVSLSGATNLSLLRNRFVGNTVTGPEVLVTFTGSATSSCGVTIDRNYFSGIAGTGDPEAFHSFSTSGASPTVPCSLRLTNNEITGFAESAFEIQNGALTSCEVSGNYIHDPSGSGEFLMGTISTAANSLPTAVGGPPYGCQVYDNTVVVNTANAQTDSQDPAAQSQLGFFEVFSTGAQVYANNFDRTNLALGGVGLRVEANTIRFAAGSPAMGFNPNFLTGSNKITGNLIIEPQTQGIEVSDSGAAGGGGNVIADNTIVRTPGSWTTDNTSGQNFVAIADSTIDPQNPTIIRDDHVFFGDGSANMLTLCGVAESIAQSGRRIEGLVVNNLSATAQGNAFCDFGSTSYAGSSIAKLRAINLSHIANAGADITGLTAAIDNQSLIGSGSGAPPTNNIISALSYADLHAGVGGQTISCADCELDAGGYPTAGGGTEPVTLSWNAGHWRGAPGAGSPASACSNGANVSGCTVGPDNNNVAGNGAFTVGSGGISNQVVLALTWGNPQVDNQYECSWTLVFGGGNFLQSTSTTTGSLYYAGSLAAGTYDYVYSCTHP